MLDEVLKVFLHTF